MVRVKFGLLAKLAALVFFVVVILPIIVTIFSNSLSNYEDDVVATSLKQESVTDNDEMKTYQIKDLNPVFKNGILGNYEQNLKPRVGPGENGEGVTLLPNEKSKAAKTIREFGFNMVASDKISLDRSIKDTRNKECKYWSYPEVKNLPTASVVLVFHNEGWSTLMRTVHSVINTSPPELIADIILVDDFSTTEDLKEKLENYIKRFNGIVKLVRTTKREGLVQARVIGAEASKGEVIVILDAHCECVVNWLPPLLTRIALNRKTVAVPIVDGIDWNTLAHNSIYGDARNRGIFEWGFLYKEKELPQQEISKHTQDSEPYWSPTHAGGLLAIEKNWFFELGGYDPGIKIWGAEQYELSFKVWQCGGTLEWVPCSHVGHIYRGPRTVSTHPANSNPHQSVINHMRLAEVWMDEYKEYYYIREPQIKKLDYGDISKQKAIRDKLQCKSFKWFMETIAYDLVGKFPLPPKNQVWGEIVNKKHNTCFDTNGASFGQPIGVSSCHHYGGSQLFRLNVEGELSNGEHCFVSDRNIVKNKFCLNYKGVWNPIGEWQYDEITQMIKSNKEKTCIATDGKSLALEACDSANLNQKWEFNEIYY